MFLCVCSTGRVTLRNRRFLRKFSPRTDPDYLENTEVPIVRNSSSDLPLKPAPPVDLKLNPVIETDSTIDHDTHGSNPPHSSFETTEENVSKHLEDTQPLSPDHCAPDGAQEVGPSLLRRSSRVPVPRKLYDAATGKYV